MLYGRLREVQKGSYTFLVLNTKNISAYKKWRKGLPYMNFIISDQRPSQSSSTQMPCPDLRAEKGKEFVLTYFSKKHDIKRLLYGLCERCVITNSVGCHCTTTAIRFLAYVQYMSLRSFRQ